MIVIISDPTEKDLELVKRILGDKTINEFHIDDTENRSEWMSAPEFETLANERGHKCKYSISRKRLADKYNISYREAGNRLEFLRSQALKEIPDKLKLKK